MPFNDRHVPDSFVRFDRHPSETMSNSGVGDPVRGIGSDAVDVSCSQIAANLLSLTYKTGSADIATMKRSKSQHTKSKYVRSH
jgi:hypothetical protein